jgi:hypothetical protein|tara:strand:- start:77 stop:271 length:195 start_codon:yes stop_codon:yes gene_type:complete
MKKKKSLYKLIKNELRELNIMLDQIDKLDDDIFKHIALKRTRDEYYNKNIKPLMIIYQVSKNKK